MLDQNRFNILAAGLFCAAALLSGCDPANNMVSVDEYGSSNAVEGHTTPSDVYISLQPYEVGFDGRDYDAENDLTTFSYRVSRTGNGPVMSHFIVELPECAPEPHSYEPSRQVHIGREPITDIYGIKWLNKVEKGGSTVYSVTFPGDIPLGTIQVSMQGGPGERRPYVAGSLPGPCKDAVGFAVAGSVFSDANADGSIDDVELGIAGVTVTLEDDAGPVAAAQTDDDGNYRFSGLAAGAYTIRVPAATDADDFNENLAAYFEHTGADPADPSLEVTVGPDSEDNLFGFAPVTQNVIDTIESGDLVTTGKPVAYWKEQLEAAIDDGEEGEGDTEGEIDAETLEGYLDLIETWYLPDPFKFGDDDRLEAALNILRHDQDAGDWYELREELLAAELNQAHGLGTTGASDLQSALIAWGEGLVAANPPEEESAGKFASATLLEAAVMFNYLNGGGGQTNE